MSKKQNRKCLGCGKIFQYYLSTHKGKQPLYCTNCPKRQFKQESWSVNKRGVTVGYVRVNNKKISKIYHRWVIEKEIGRTLTSNEIVHHINHNKLDNRLENLQVMSKKEHSLIHGKEWNNHQRIRRFNIYYYHENLYNELLSVCKEMQINIQNKNLKIKAQTIINKANKLGDPPKIKIFNKRGFYEKRTGL
jgi:hypothetical protein